MTPIAYAIIIILQALTDALFFNGDKAMSKIVEDIVIVSFIFVPLTYTKITYKHLIGYGIIYLFFRIALFDPFFNLFAGLDIMHTGTTTYVWDNLMSRFSDWKFWIVRAWFLFLGLFIWFKVEFLRL